MRKSHMDEIPRKITPRKATREEIEGDPRWRPAIREVFFLMFELGVSQIELRKDGKLCHTSMLPEIESDELKAQRRAAGVPAQ